MKVLLLANAGSTLVMVGIIWFVQVVHYPLFEKVGKQHFAAYSEAHSRLTGYVVGPPMLLEAATAVALLFWRPTEIPLYAALAGVVLVAGIWASTALLQAPRHSRLARGFDAPAHRFLVLTNWLRTVLWSARGALVLWMVYLSLG